MVKPAVCAEFCSNRKKVNAAKRRLPPAALLRAAGLVDSRDHGKLLFYSYTGGPLLAKALLGLAPLKRSYPCTKSRLSPKNS